MGSNLIQFNAIQIHISQPFNIRFDILPCIYTSPNRFPSPSDFPSFSSFKRVTCSTDIIVLGFVNTIMSGEPKANMGTRMSHLCGQMCLVKTWEMPHLRCRLSYQIQTRTSQLVALGALCGESTEWSRWEWGERRVFDVL